MFSLPDLRRTSLLGPCDLIGSDYVLVHRFAAVGLRAVGLRSTTVSSRRHVHTTLPSFRPDKLLFFSFSVRSRARGGIL